MKKQLSIVFFFLFLACTPFSLFCEQSGGEDVIARILEKEKTQKESSSASNETEEERTVGGPNVITMMSVIAFLSLLPFVIVLLTSFLKIVIVLSLLRNALGVQQSPPNQALVGVALLMSIYVMFPTGVAMYDAGKQYILKEVPRDLFSKDAAVYLYRIIGKAKEPLKQFLVKNMSTSHQRRFYQIAFRSVPKDFQGQLKIDDFIVLAPAYITSQLKEAFATGVLIYLPFFVIDLVTSNILLAMGMMMLSPLTIALPLKLLLIVMTDGWTLVIQGLVQSYKS